MHVVGIVLHPERDCTGAVGSILEWADRRDIQVLGIDTEVRRLACTAEAVTALPDGTFLLLPELVPAELFPAVRPVAEEGGSHVVPLGGDRVLIAASAPRTAGLLEDLGFTPVVVDISEFEKLEGCVTCLSVLLPGR